MWPVQPATWNWSAKDLLLWLQACQQTVQRRRRSFTRVIEFYKSIQVRQRTEQPGPLVTSHLLFFTIGVVASKLPSLQTVTEHHRVQTKSLQVCCSVHVFLIEHAEGTCITRQAALSRGCFVVTQRPRPNAYTCLTCHTHKDTHQPRQKRFPYEEPLPHIV